MNNLNSQNILVLVATFNGERYIRHQLNSIDSQSNINVSIFLSDDCSIDKTVQVVKEFRKVKVLSTERHGSASANFFRLTRCADLSAFDYVALSDQDDVWLSTKLSRAVSQLEDSQADAYSSNVTAFWPNDKPRLINKAQPQRQWDYMFESAGPGCTFVLSKKLALEIQTFLITNQAQCKHVASHDWFIYAFARSREFKWLIDRESHMLYRQHAGNVVGANIGIKAKLQRFKKLRDGWFFEQALLIAEVLGYADELPMQKIKRLSLLDRIWLILNINKLRRRLHDRIALVFFMLCPIKKK